MPCHKVYIPAKLQVRSLLQQALASTCGNGAHAAGLRAAVSMRDAAGGICAAVLQAARNLEKLTLFRQFYIMVVVYIYFTRIVVYLLKVSLVRDLIGCFEFPLHARRTLRVAYADGAVHGWRRVPGGGAPAL